MANSKSVGEKSDKQKSSFTEKDIKCFNSTYEWLAQIKDSKKQTAANHVNTYRMNSHRVHCSYIFRECPICGTLNGRHRGK